MRKIPFNFSTKISCAEQQDKDRRKNIDMTPSLAAESLLKLHEGLRTKVYECPAGKLTVGYGRNLEDKGITVAEAAFLLQSDIKSIVRDLETEKFFYSQNFARKAVLIDMSFNLGMSGLKSFKKMITALEKGDHQLAAAEMSDSKWATQVKTRADRLINMMKTGTWPDDLNV